MSTQWNFGSIACDTDKVGYLPRTIHSQHGVATIEYSLVAALIALIALGSIDSTGSTLRTLWENNAAEIVAAIAESLTQ